MSEIRDNLKTIVDKTIDTIDRDVYSVLMPILGDKVNKNYFKAYQISVVEGLTDKEYKTISYLAPFVKEKIKYNVKEIVRYLRWLGYADVTYNDVFLLAVHKSVESKINYYCKLLKQEITIDSYKLKDEAISIDEYLAQKPFDFFVTVGANNNSDVRYRDGFVTNFDVEQMK
jgi:hypothetical protein